MSMRPVSANVVTGAMRVSATELRTCTVRKIADLSFGINDFAEGSDLNETAGTGAHTGEIDLTCGDDTYTTVGFGNGSNFDGSSRRMADGSGHYLRYILCQNVASASNDCALWNDTYYVQPYFFDSGSRSTDKILVHGIVMDGGSNDVPDSSYSDIVEYTVTINA
jgi:spore coat protein U-like protein